MLGADEIDLTVAIATVFGAMTDPRKRLRAVRAARVQLTQVAEEAVAECRKAGSSWRAIALALGEAPATAFRHYGGAGDEPDEPEEVTAQEMEHRDSQSHAIRSPERPRSQGEGANDEAGAEG
jgi:hypothetical protein